MIDPAGDRRAFRASVLRETLRELLRPAELHIRLDGFLLSIMGASAALKGFILHCDPFDAEHRVLARGLSEAERTDIERKGSAVVEACFHNDEARGPRRDSEVLVIRSKPAPNSGFPKDVELVLGLKTAAGARVLLGLGPKPDGAPHNEFEIADLESLLDGLSQALDADYAARALKQKTEQLKTALDRAQDAKVELDRRVFHVNTLYDAAVELSGVVDSVEIVRTFLLILAGTFSLSAARALIYDAKTDRFIQGFWGEGLKGPIDRPEAMTLLYELFGQSGFAAVEEWREAPAAPEVVHRLAPKLDFEPKAVRLVRMHGKGYGLVALSEKLTGEDFLEADEQAFSALMGHFLVKLKNALSFETIMRLNAEMAERNAELSRTIDELTHTKRRTNVLETKLDSVLSAVESGRKRLERTHWYDFAAILLLSLALGLGYNTVNPNKLPITPEEWTRPAPAFATAIEAAALIKEGKAQIVDARPKPLFDQLRIAGAKNLEPKLFDFSYDLALGEVDLDVPVIVYGRTISKRYDEAVAAKLAARGHETVSVVLVEPGDWRKIGGRVEGQALTP